MRAFDFFLVLVSKKRLIGLHFLVTFILSILFSLFLQLYYKSEMIFLPPEEQRGLDLPSLVSGGLVSNSDILSNYYRIKGDHIGIILKSRSIRTKLIKKFNLVTSYKLQKSKRKTRDALRILNKRIEIEEIKHSGLGFSSTIAFRVAVTDTSPTRAFHMMNFFFDQTQLVVAKISREKAEQARVFVEGRLVANKRALEKAKSTLIDFQTKNKFLNPSTQIDAAIENYADLKSTIFLRSLQLELENSDFRKGSRRTLLLRNQIKALNKKLTQLEDGDGKSDYLVRLKVAPELAATFFELEKNVRVFKKIDLLLIQQNEMAKIQEAKSVSTLKVIDPPYIPEYKHKPSRAIIVLLITFGELSFLIFILCFSHYYKIHLVNNSDFSRLRSAFKTGKE